MKKKEILELMSVLKYMLSDVEDKIKGAETNDIGRIVSGTDDYSLAEIEREIQFLRDNLIRVKKSLNRWWD